MNHNYVVAMIQVVNISNHDNENLTKKLVSSPKTYINIKNGFPFCRAHPYALEIILLLLEQCLYFIMLC